MTNDTTSKRGADLRVDPPHKNKSQAIFSRKNILLVAIGLILVIVFIAVMTSLNRGKSTRSESYKDISGSAGLQASIDYNAQCDKQPCKPTYDFNIYIFNNDGQQVGVIRPDKDGNVSMALPEGNYSMLIGKQFSKDGLFPQEPLVLKNGKTLDLKLQYK